MKKMTYIQPKMEMQPMLADAHVMLLDSNSHVDAPKRHEVAPAAQPGPAGVWM